MNAIARRVVAGLSGLMLLVLTPLASAFEIPLTLQEQHGVSGPRRVTCGVPLLVGQARDVKALRLLAVDDTGKKTPVAAQFRELARWWRADNSIRWVLVDFATELAARQPRAFVLTDAKADAPATALTVAQDENAITVNTGVARFVINRKAFNFLDKAIVDVNGDGKLGDDEDLLAGAPETGAVAEDAFGQTYLGSRGTTSVQVIESGPMRVCVRARGRQLAPQGKGYTPGLYGYDVFLNFYAGSGEVYTDVVITNNFASSIGTPAMEDASLVLRLADGAATCTLIGDKAGQETAMAKGQSVCLYQDSNGADTWKTCSGFGDMQVKGWRQLTDQFTSFRGYRIFSRTTDQMRMATQSDGGGEVIGQGDHARGTLRVKNDRGDVVVHMKNFWQQFPKAVEVGADGTIRIGLFPREWKFSHCIPDSSAKGHEIVLSFHGAKAPAPAGYAPDASGGPSAISLADCWDARVYLRPSLEHMAATGALSDIGAYTPPTRGLDKRPGSGTEANGSRMLTTDELYGNAYGWRIFGERWRSNGGHGGHGARQPIDQDNYLYYGYLTGSRQWLEAGDNRSRQFRDVRCYRLDDQDALAVETWLNLRAGYTMENRQRTITQTDEMKKYQDSLPDYGSPWEFPNPEHCVLDLLYDRYLLLGDVRSLENMRVAAAIGGLFARDHAPAADDDMDAIGRNIGRSNGWSWRTLERYWDLTGDKQADKLLRETIQAYEPLIGKSPLWFGNDRKASMWFTQIFSRGIAMTALHTGDARALEICKSFAEGKEKDAGSFSTLFAVLYHLTGDAKYKAPLAEIAKGDRLLSVGGYFPAADHWLLNQPPRPRQ